MTKRELLKEDENIQKKQLKEDNKIKKLIKKCLEKQGRDSFLKENKDDIFQDISIFLLNKRRETGNKDWWEYKEIRNQVLDWSDTYYKQKCIHIKRPGEKEGEDGRPREGVRDFEGKPIKRHGREIGKHKDWIEETIAPGTDSESRRDKDNLDQERENIKKKLKEIAELDEAFKMEVNQEEKRLGLDKLSKRKRTELMVQKNLCDNPEFTKEDEEWLKKIKQLKRNTKLLREDYEKVRSLIVGNIEKEAKKISTEMNNERFQRKIDWFIEEWERFPFKRLIQDKRYNDPEDLYLSMKSLEELKEMKSNKKVCPKVYRKSSYHLEFYKMITMLNETKE